MNAWRIFRWVLWRGVLSGVVLGILYAETITSIAVLNGYLGLCLVGLFFGALFGGGFGIALGTLNGLALVGLTAFFFNPVRSMLLYRWSALLLSVICTVVGCYLVTHVLFEDQLSILIPSTILATLAAGTFAWRLPDAVITHDEKNRHPLANAVLFYIEK
jgi:hypothetical protein